MRRWHRGAHAKAHASAKAPTKPKSQPRLARFRDGRCATSSTTEEGLDPGTGCGLADRRGGHVSGDAGHRLGVLSNTCAAHWNYCLPRYTLLRKFEVYALSFEIGAMKPDPTTYRAAADLAGAAPEEIFFTDDRPENVEAALAAGYDAVPFTTAARLADDLRRRGVEFNY